ncbi:thiopeptide-type bacteriocin biosynthesis protein [Chryseobacterium sp. MEBOG06]|uniref:thiopeptide-type bacteriocin biosynthesis protein n=1 Tax=Chryseobacterium sp. MEBOG06 TaxID=2879938 RepID=UPI001F15F347|nr:thiopeptide-type bacteriocin biosynthesis protein [Chryseobacterium sp. MEBOG06]UKB84709.1 thiopeptide-type bacteriocin biosynthesis protein [Chryseobacterium sp. MEBOG06]
MAEQKSTIADEWLYFKIYTGIKTADTILEESIEPLVKYLQENNHILKWFFIRYNDPKSHLRIRFKLNRTNKTEHYVKALDEINQTLQQYIESGEISTILIDRYKQEVERYGSNTMEDAETLFHKNSEFTLQCLHYNNVEKITVNLFYIDELLNKINTSIEKKLEWIINLNNAFKKEFNVDKRLNSQLDKKYREFKPQYLNFIRSEEFLEERNLIIANIEASNTAFQNIIHHHENQSLEIPLQSFFQSIFHMNINRLFISDQRLFEMVIYDYLRRYYKTEAFKSS